MAPLTKYRWLCRLALALLALAAVLRYAPSQAAASCGDYVTMTSGHGQPVPLEQPSVPPVASERASGDQVPRYLQLGGFAQPYRVPQAPPCQRCPREPGDAPCRGPWCSGTPVPLPAPPTTVEHAPQQWACWCAAHCGAANGAIALHPLHDAQDRIHHVFPVYHPPRSL